MHEDYSERVGEAYGWPGDVMIEGRQATLTSYLRQLTTEGYLSDEELAGAMRVPGLPMWDGVPERLRIQEQCGFKLYRTTEADVPACLFMATRNFSYGKPVDRRQPPILEGSWIPIGSGDEMIGRKLYPVLVVRMDGSGIVISESKAVKTPSVAGLLPGRRQAMPEDVETAADTLALH